MNNHLPNKMSLDYLYNTVLQKLCKGGDVPLLIQPLNDMVISYDSNTIDKHMVLHKLGNERYDLEEYKVYQIFLTKRIDPYYREFGLVKEIKQELLPNYTNIQIIKIFLNE